MWFGYARSERVVLSFLRREKVVMRSIGGTFSPLEVGEIVDDRYEILRQLGVGNMGVVYACRHICFPRSLLALKVLAPADGVTKETIARFENEVVTSYEVSHPNVVKTYELVRHNKQYCFTMEYVKGRDLGDLFSRKGPKTLKEAYRILYQLISALEAIHELGIIHRDLKTGKYSN